MDRIGPLTHTPNTTPTNTTHLSHSLSLTTTPKKKQTLPSQTLQDRQRYLLTLLDSLIGETTTPNGPIPEAAAALAPAANGYTPPEVEGDGSEDGTGLDRVLFLAYALAMWTLLSLAAQGGVGGGAGRAFAAEVWMMMDWVG